MMGIHHYLGLKNLRNVCDKLFQIDNIFNFFDIYNGVNR